MKTGRGKMKLNEAFQIGERMRNEHRADRPTEGQILYAWQDGSYPWASACEDFPFHIPSLAAAWRCGALGKPAPRLGYGWRYGKAPACGASHNFREGHQEAGISLMGLWDQEVVPTLEMQAYEAFNCAQKIVWLRGWILPWAGSDGEPLMVGASEV